MKRKKPRGNELKENKPETFETVWQKAFNSMCNGLDKYGRYEILTLLVTNSHRDAVVNQLLVIYPGLVATGEFLRNFRYNIRVSRRLFRRLQREHSIL